MDPLLIIAAFVFGVVTSNFGLPPLVGYLLAGFVLNSFGIQGSEILGNISNIGVTLLLFTIGLKMKLKNLAKPEVWAGTTIHMLITVIVFGAGIWAIRLSGVPFFRFLNLQAALLLSFALSFSSTVFAVKVFEEKKEMASRYASIAIGILIMQDIIAVVFLSSSTGRIPSCWSIVLAAGLLIMRPLLVNIMARCGHGELLMLFGILMATAGYSSFEMVELKGDLGALVFGMLLANSPKANELADHLLGFKNLFLVGFFLNIGLSGAPTLGSFMIAFGLALVMPFKAVLIFGILTRFKLRARTSMLASFSLANYSEFGLIVGSIGVSNGLIESQWLIIVAMALSTTFIMAAPLNSAAHSIYARVSGHLKYFETMKRLPEDQPIDTGQAQIAVLGMGRVGASAYDEIRKRYGDVVIGVDFCHEKVENHRKLGRDVIYGDAEDSDFWERFKPKNSFVSLIMLALPSPEASIFAIRQLKQENCDCQIAATVRYEDEIQRLMQEGISAVYSLYDEAGAGFADHVCHHKELCKNTKQMD